MIAYQAPGKAVIWGEYAVLAGAPALVMAVDRYARVALQPGGPSWRCRALGFQDSRSVSAADLLHGPLDSTGAAAPLAAAARALGATELPAGAEVELDTRPFYAAGTGEKLGIGSSAAVCTAACAAMARLLDRELSFAEALDAHQRLQNAAGSGIDVAASFHGGVLRFQAGCATPAVWPADLDFQFIWTGVSAKTTRHLSAFAEWRARSDADVLTRLGDACEGLFECSNLERLGDYVASLRQLDQEAGLGIYTPAHSRLHELAISRQVVYKPCGAGGGDIGVAFAKKEDNEALEAFTRAARQEAFHPLSLEIAAHGIEPTR